MENNTNNIPKMSLISKLNYVRLIFRSIVFIVALEFYVVCKLNDMFYKGNPEAKNPWLSFPGSPDFHGNALTYSVLGIVMIVYIFAMCERFFPVKTSSMGSQKQFKRNFRPTGETKPFLQKWWRTLIVFGSWAALNGTFATLYYLNVAGVINWFDAGVMLLISLAYGVCDIICILFFCPFQTWMMRNRCCTACRIYNWDFAMMATPLIFLIYPFDKSYSIYAIILVSLSMILLLRWEITYKIHPERYAINTNASLDCVNCKEKLCAHKKQLQAFLRSGRQIIGQTKSKKNEKEAEKPQEQQQAN